MSTEPLVLCCNITMCSGSGARPELVAYATVANITKKCEKTTIAVSGECPFEIVVDQDVRHTTAEAAEAKAEVLRRRFQRLQVTSEILELGRLLPCEDVTVHPDDVGAAVHYRRPYVPGVNDSALATAAAALPSTADRGEREDITHRRAGYWRGTPVTVEDIVHTKCIDGLLEGKNSPESRNNSTATTSTVALNPGSLSLKEPDADASEKRRSSGMKLNQHLVVQAAGKEAAGSSAKQMWEEAVRKELRLTGRLRHPNLVEFYGATVDGGELHIISEPPLVPLKLELEARQAPWLSRHKCRRGLVYDVSLALDYLHSHGVAHRCVALDHIFLRDGVALDGTVPTAKLGGLLPMRIFHRIRCEMHASQTVPDAGNGRRTIGVRGDQSARGRERHASNLNVIDPRSSDVYALGTLAVQLLTAEIEDPEKVSGAVRSAAVNRITDRTLRLVVLRCMEKDPQYRMSARMVVRALCKIASGAGVVCLEEIPDDPSVKTPLCDMELALTAAGTPLGMNNVQQSK